MTTTANKSVEDAIKELEGSIAETNLHIELLKSIDWSKPVSEKDWHMICKTPLRTSNLLEILVKNTFTEAENVEVSPNYVRFNLYGFQCFIPTTKCIGIEVNTNWYEKDCGIPKETAHCMKNYFDALDNHESWEVLFKHRLPKLHFHRKWVKFLMWFGWFKWNDSNRDICEKEFEKHEVAYHRSVSDYYERRKNINNKTKLMVDKLIPELNKFTPSIRVYRDYTSFLMNIDIKDIIEMEGFVFEKGE